MQQRDGAEHFIAHQLEIQRSFSAARFHFANRIEALEHYFLAGFGTGKEPHGHERYNGNHQCHVVLPFCLRLSRWRYSVCDDFSNFKVVAIVPFLVHGRMVKHRRRQVNSRDGEFFRKLRTDSGGHEIAHDFPALAYAFLPVDEDVLHGDDFAFHSAYLGYVNYSAFSVAETRDLNHHVDSRRDLAANRMIRNIQAGHGHHGLQARQSIPRRIRVNRGQRAVMARVHRLQHVERFLAAHLADDDAVGTHTQGVDEQLAHVDGAFAFDVGWARLQANDVFLVQLQFGRVFNRDDALAIRNIRGQNV